MKLAGKNGMNPEKWDGNVAVWLLKKSDPKYYNDSVVKNGYFRELNQLILSQKFSSGMTITGISSL